MIVDGKVENFNFLTARVHDTSHLLFTVCFSPASTGLCKPVDTEFLSHKSKAKTRSQKFYVLIESCGVGPGSDVSPVKRR